MYYCPLTFQCINQSENCNWNTPYIGGGQGVSTTPYGESCPSNKTYCPLFAACIPTDEVCCLAALATFISDSTIGYFGQNCSEGETFCPGTQSCLLNTSSCTFNESLINLNITCFDNSSYCMGERKCSNETCTSPVRPSFSFNDTVTGMSFTSPFFSTFECRLIKL